MRTKCRFISHLAALGAAGLLAAPAGAQPTNNPNNFNDGTSTTSFVTWWTGGGVPNPTMTWDDTRDAFGNPNSGSVRYEVLFQGAASEQFATWFSIANRWQWDAGTILDGTKYTNVAFDIKVDPVSAITPGGNYGNMEVGLVWHVVDGDTWGQTTVKTYPVPLGATNWTHVNLPIDLGAPNLDKIVGFFFKMWSDGAHTNSLIFNLDNVAMEKPEIFVPLTPPTLGLGKTTPGLNFIAASGGQYDRQSIRTVGSNYSWISASGPVSYSVDVAQIGVTNPSGFTLFLHFVPGGADPARPDSDWHEPNVMMWRIMNNDDGSAWSDLRYKTNSPDSNGHLWDSGGLPGGVGNPTPAGTWTITFSQDTNIIITAPAGGSITNILPPEVVTIFNVTPTMQINVGAVPGELYRIGQVAVLTGAHISGTPGAPNLDSSFLGVPLDTNAWSIVASSAAYGVQMVPTEQSFWLNWTLPAANFRLQSSTTLAPNSWVDSPLAGFAAAGKQNVLVASTNLPGANAGYFRLMRQGTAAKLLVLLPGENLAPGTETGKTGAPVNQPTLTEFNVTIVMLDADNYPVRNATDLIHLSSSGTQIVVLPPDTDLTDGFLTVPVSSWDEGEVTITATDVTNPAIAIGSSTLTFVP